MHKKVLIGALMVSSIIASAQSHKTYENNILNRRQLEGSPIYIPRRHKFKKKIKDKEVR